MLNNSHSYQPSCKTYIYRCYLYSCAIKRSIVFLCKTLKCTSLKPALFVIVIFLLLFLGGGGEDSGLSLVLTHYFPQIFILSQFCTVRPAAAQNTTVVWFFPSWYPTQDHIMSFTYHQIKGDSNSSLQFCCTSTSTKQVQSIFTDYKKYMKGSFIRNFKTIFLKYLLVIFIIHLLLL